MKKRTYIINHSFLRGQRDHAMPYLGEASLLQIKVHVVFLCRKGPAFLNVCIIEMGKDPGAVAVGSGKLYWPVKRRMGYKRTVVW